MIKAEFLDHLKRALGRLPKHEVDQSLAFYSEVIDDRMEDGMTEEAAVASLGDINQIATQITNEMPAVPKAIAKANTGSRTLNIVLLIVFSPLWVPVALALAIVAFAIWFTLWALIFSLWLTVFCLLLAGVVGIIGLFVLIATGHLAPAILCLATGLASAGIGLFCYFGVVAASRGLFSLTKSWTRKIRSLFVKEERA